MAFTSALNSCLVLCLFFAFVAHWFRQLRVQVFSHLHLRPFLLQGSHLLSKARTHPETGGPSAMSWTWNIRTEMLRGTEHFEVAVRWQVEEWSTYPGGLLSTPTWQSQSGSKLLLQQHTKGAEKTQRSFAAQKGGHPMRWSTATPESKWKQCYLKAWQRSSGGGPWVGQPHFRVQTHWSARDWCVVLPRHVVASPHWVCIGLHLHCPNCSQSGWGDATAASVQTQWGDATARRAARRWLLRRWECVPSLSVKVFTHRVQLHTHSLEIFYSLPTEQEFLPDILLKSLEFLLPGQF